MNHLITKMLSHANPAEVPGLMRFFKTGPGQYGEGDKFLGIKVPVTRAIVKECWKEATMAHIEECVTSPYHEIRLAGFLALIQKFSHAKKDPATQQVCIEFYLAHTAHINNWDLVDLTCYPLLGEWLLDKDRTLLYNLASHGKTIWEQRIGIVTTMTFIRKGQLEDTFAIADILLHHPHDLIQKATGWLLRECGKRNKASLESFLAPRYKTMPRTALRYAIEKFPQEERSSYLKGTMRSIEVVAAIIIKENMVYATQRGYGEFAGWWEFPGGKTEAGESLEDALKREIREELGAEIEVGKLLDTIEWDYPNFHLTMHCFVCSLLLGKMQLNEHQADAWLNAESLHSVRWLPADEGLMPKIKELLG